MWARVEGAWVDKTGLWGHVRGQNKGPCDDG